ncbi:hypothetical protein [Clostridium thailandense]|uniref:hypothetical protein n=1 Tax=Clostridium thailandense TaxID=2794346 RepID=UPI003988FC4A
MHNNVPIILSNLAFRDRLYLGALLRLSLSEDMQYIGPINDDINSLAPTLDMAKEIVLSLSNKNIIVPHPDSDINAFTYKETEDRETFPNTFYIYKVKYHLNLGESHEKENIIKCLLNPLEVTELDNVMIPTIWKEIATAECLESLNYQMGKVSFDFTPGHKPIAVIEELLNDFCTAQVFGIIYKGVTSAVRYYQEIMYRENRQLILL